MIPSDVYLQGARYFFAIGPLPLQETFPAAIVALRGSFVFDHAKDGGPPIGFTADDFSSIAARSCVPLILARDRYNAFDAQGRRRWPPALHRETSRDFGESEQDKHVTLVAANAFPEPCILLHCGGNNDLPAVGTFVRHI